ncbi:lyase family protein [Primorskyibacter marinus]|uniref:lyase family protein n=1 Tax=Primorskyibacter marinus TaxID=1977320 RepID=UPI000E304DC4|nr:lyase family protein [Primorskyibacter marinus]
MTATPFDSAHLGGLFDTGETARLFSDTAEVRAMQLVEGALAQAQGQAGIIPEISAAAIQRAAMEVLIDPAQLREATAQNGVSVPALVAAFRHEMSAPEHAQYVHWGATSQDILDTAQMLRLKQVLAQYEAGLTALIGALATQAEAHADLPMAARTYGQHATPTSFGALTAQWGAPLLDLLAELRGMRETGLWVSLSGAAGTASALGDKAPALRAAIGAKLGLTDPGRSWHTDRAPILRLAQWITRLLAALGKLGTDLVLLTQSGISEIRLAASGGSSTMPQKQNPVGPSALIALWHHGAGLASTLSGTAGHALQRDGAAWFTEWLTLPQLCLTAASALGHAEALAASLVPDAAQMQATLDSAQGLLNAEALSFALTARMPRPDAQAAVKALCQRVVAEDGDLIQMARAEWPDLPAEAFDKAAMMGRAPAEARGFAAAARTVLPQGD